MSPSEEARAATMAADIRHIREKLDDMSESMVRKDVYEAERDAGLARIARNERWWYVITGAMGSAVVGLLVERLLG